MALGIGIDIGSASIKAALVGDDAAGDILDALIRTRGFTPMSHQAAMPYRAVLSPYRRILGRPLDAVTDLLAEITRDADISSVPVIVTGAGAKLVAASAGATTLSEFSAIIAAVNAWFPMVRTVFEMGGETSKYILLDAANGNGRLTIADYATNGDCAAGTGSFIDQQSKRLMVPIEQVGAAVARAGTAPRIAGRCSVFAKSDMIHAQQRGYTPDEVLKGLCDAVARNFKSAVTRSRTIVPPVMFVGGMAMNAGIVDALAELFDLDDGSLIVPEAMCWMGALGCALTAAESTPVIETPGTMPARSSGVTDTFARTKQLTLDRVTLLRTVAETPRLPAAGETVPVYIGIDIGSVSTNLVVVNDAGDVLHEIYTRTNARPIEVVTEGLREIDTVLGDRLDVRGVGTTGSGRELIGILVGADAIKDEITAHKTGAVHISRRYLGRDVDTIFEIGGQDSKFIAIQDGIVVDFAMNEACAAGTGSFLEEQAEELDVRIIDDFARRALSSTAPLKLGERCTVFMGKDVVSCLQNGAAKNDIIAGLAYSVVHNYLNRVVHGRTIGDTIFFQGGTAYNDAVAAAFAEVTGREIIVPPHNGVVGAIGAALLARREIGAGTTTTTFRGFDIAHIDYALTEFTCKGCSNYCTIQEFTVDGEKTYWGDKCSERYRKRKKTTKTAVGGDMTSFREKTLEKWCANGGTGPLIGIPMSLYSYDRLPLFTTYFSRLGFRTLVTGPTTTRMANTGIERLVAEPCYPITVAHGHIDSLVESSADHIWLPNIINAETDTPETESYVCVWGSTIPYVARHNPAFAPHADRFLMPTLHFRDGIEAIKRELFAAVKPLGVRRSASDRAVEAGFAAQEGFRGEIFAEGRRVLDAVAASGEKAIVLFGRPYNIYDKLVNLSVATKLTSLYGITVIPIDFIDTTNVSIKHVNSNMFWNYGRRILQTAVSLASEPALEVIYITNFKCGPDSFIKQFVDEALGRPFLILQFDGHSNDAGMMTRCEAYLDSKGFFGTREVCGER